MLHRTKNIIFVKASEAWDGKPSDYKETGPYKMILGERDNGHFFVVANISKESPIELISEDIPSFPPELWDYQAEYGVRILKLKTEEDRFLFKLVQ